MARRSVVWLEACLALRDGVSVALASSSKSASTSPSVELLCSSGRISALSLLSPPRRGSVFMLRVVASRRWLQKRQCWVWIGRRWSVILWVGGVVP